MNLNVLRQGYGSAVKWFRKVRWRYYVQDSFWREACSAGKVPIEKIQLQKDGSLQLTLGAETLELPKTDIAVTLLKSYVKLESISRNSNSRFSWNAEYGALDCVHDGVLYQISSADDAYVLREILLDGVYGCYFCRPTVVVDVGANVGFAALQFAANNPDARVVACEPLHDVYLRAISNVALNPHLKERISIHNVALFSHNGEEVVRSNTHNRVRSSLVIDNPELAVGKEEAIAVTVSRASEFIRKVVKNNQGRALVLKLDCEGSEYAILDDLISSGSLCQVNMVMFEWHRVDSSRNDNWLKHQLVKEGFDVVMQEQENIRTKTGMGYAYNSGRLSLLAMSRCATESTDR
jgi:FkbM family methyltransferase